MNILVTGANGQLGHELAAILSGSEDHAFLTDTDTLDVTRKEEVEKYFINHDIHVMVNCAAYTRVDQAEKETAQAEMVNTLATSYLREVSSRFGSWVIHLSTDYVFDGNSPKPYLENDPARPLSAYGRTKLGGEQALRNYKKGIVIRTSWLYSHTGTNFVKTILTNGLNKPILRVVNDQVGSPTCARDLASAIHIIIQHIRLKPVKVVPGIYHYSNEGIASWYDFAWEIVRLAHLPCRVMPVPTSQYLQHAPRPFYSVLSKEKIKQAFGITIPHWKESLENFIKEYNR